MHRTAIIRQQQQQQRAMRMAPPVLTFLTRNPTSSQKTQQLFQSLFHIKPINLTESLTRNQDLNNGLNQNDSHDAKNSIETLSCSREAMNSVFSWGGKRHIWDSRISLCSSTGTLLHFLSLSDHSSQCNSMGLSSSSENNASGGGRNGTYENLISLLAVTGTTCTTTTNNQEEITTSSSIQPDEKANDATQDHLKREAIIETILHTRQSLANKIQQEQNNSWIPSFWYCGTLALRQLTGQSISVRHLLDYDGIGVPLIQLPQRQEYEEAVNTSKIISTQDEHEISSSSSSSLMDAEQNEPAKMRLREIVLPYSTTPTNSKQKEEDLITLQQQFSRSALSRPKTGLYQWPSSTTATVAVAASSMPPSHSLLKKNQEILFRPLPTAPKDMQAPPPALIFEPISHPTQHPNNKQQQKQQQSSSSSSSNMIEQMTKQVQNSGGVAAKIGFNSQRVGQLRVLHYDLLGLDIRFCPSKQVSLSFAESEEALMAASLPELQSIHVMAEGTDSTSSSNSTSSITGSTGSTGTRCSSSCSCSTDKNEEYGSIPNSDKNGKDVKNEDHSPQLGSMFQYGREGEHRLDAMNGLGDCWVEFRANIKRPSGFFR